MSAVKVTKQLPLLDRQTAVERIARGQIATLLSEVEAGWYDREQAMALISELVNSPRSSGIWSGLLKPSKK